MALWAALALATVARAEISQRPGLIGLLEIPKVFGRPDPSGPRGSKRLPPGKLKVYPLPQRTGVPKPWVVEGPADLSSEEWGEGLSGAVVYARKPGWFQVEADGHKGWLAESDAGTFHPLEDLLLAGQSYLTPDWERSLWARPEKSAPSQFIRKKWPTEFGAQVLASTRTREGLWLELRMMSSSGCDGEAPRKLAEGWVPAHGAAGRLQVWFKARGC